MALPLPLINVIPPSATTTSAGGTGTLSTPTAAALSAPTTGTTPSTTSEEDRLADLTYGDILALLTDPLASTITYASLSSLLLARLPVFLNPSHPFGSPSPSSRSAVSKLKLRGQPLTEEENDFILQFCTNWEVDELQCAHLWRSYTLAYSLPPLQRLPGKDARIAEEQQHTHALLRFLLEERLNVLRVLAALLRAAGNDADPMYPVARDVYQKIFIPYDEYLQKLLSGFQDRCAKPLPTVLQAREHRSLAPELARHIVQEQIALLELLFLANYTQPPSASITQSILSSLYSTQLGTAHSLHAHLMDDPGLAHTKSLKIASLLLGLSVLNLDSLWGLDLVLSEQSGTSLLTNPDTLLQIHETLLQTPSDSAYAPIVLAWSVLLHSLTESMLAAEEIPQIWLPLVRAIAPDAEKGPAILLPDRRMAFEEFASVALDPGMNLFPMIEDILTLPPFDSSSPGAAFLSAPNTLAYRSVLKSLLLSIPTLIQLPFLASLDAYLSAFCALLHGPGEEVSQLALQFWTEDSQDPLRSSILRVPATRAPLSFSPLLKLLTPLCGNGAPPSPGLSVDPPPQETCADHVWRYFTKRRQFALLLTPADIGLLWEVAPSGWVTRKPMSFPGGGIVERDAVGQILNQGDGREGVVVAWPVTWNGLHLLLDVFRAFIAKHDQQAGRRTLPPNMSTSTKMDERRKARIVNLELEEIQVDTGTEEPELVGTALDLVAALLRAKPSLAGEVDSLFSPLDKTPHPFLELGLKLLELVFLRTNPRAPPPLRLVIPLLEILASAAESPSMALRLGAYLRSAAVFAPGNAFSRLVASEQVTGSYAGMLVLIRLVSSLLTDARQQQFATPDPATHALKAEVLLQATTFLFRDVWSSFLGWRYTSLNERLVLAQRCMDLFLSILQDWAFAPLEPSATSPYRQVVYSITSTLLSNQAAITPLTAILVSAPETMLSLAKAKRSLDRELLAGVVERALRLLQLALLRKPQLQDGLTPLENAIFSSGPEPRTVSSLRSRPVAGGMIQLLFDYVTTSSPSSSVQVQAARVLYLLCRSIGPSSSSPSFVGALDDPVGTVNTLVQDVLQNPMVPIPLRTAVWDFAAATIDTKQAVGSIFLTGSLPIGLGMSEKARGKRAERPGSTGPASASASAVSAAIALVKGWEKQVDDDCSVTLAALNFLDVCWRQYTQYSDALDEHRKDGALWKTLAAIAMQNIGPDVNVDKFDLHFTVTRKYCSSLDEDVARHSDRLLLQAHAVHLLSLDMAVESEKFVPGEPRTSPESFKNVEDILGETKKATEVLSKAIESPYSPAFMAGVARDLKPFSGFDTDLLRCPPVAEGRQGGDEYLYSLEEVFTKLRGFSLGDNQVALALKRACALNLTWSLLDRHVALTRSWQALFEAATPWISTLPTLRPALISSVASLAAVIAAEQRDGNTMVAVHSTRIALLQAIIGSIGIPTNLPAIVQTDLYGLMGSIRTLVVHEHFSPLDSFRGRVTPAFHRPLLQIVQWCGRLLATRDAVKTRTAQQWTTVSSAMTAILEFLVPALRSVFADAVAQPTEQPSADLELLVTMFDRCTKPELHPVPALWLSLCDDADLIRISLEVLALTDIGRTNKNPSRQLLHAGYANHVLTFHMALTKAALSAESLARAGVLSVYTENCLTPMLEHGDVLPRDPDTNGRSMAHEVWCMMLSITTALLGISSLTSDLLEAKVVMLVQSYGRQLTGALGWKVEESLSLPLLEELERTVAFFYTMSVRSSTEQELSSPTWALLSVYSEKALNLLQQLNYAVTHPNHTLSLLEPFSQEEHAFFEQDEQIGASRSSADTIDPAKRPALAALMQRLFLISRDIMSSMTALSRPDAVIRSAEMDEWWIPAKVHAPAQTAAVSIDEPASIGTLLELGNVARDTLAAITSFSSSNISNKPVSSCTVSCPTFDKILCTQALRETLEMLLLYITAEITRGIYFGQEVDTSLAGEDPDASTTSRRPKGAATSDPAQRALRGELLAELKELLSKAGVLFEKMDGPGKKGGITSVLDAHMQKKLGNVAA
ncbi:hypothetical protein DACRYDRAFT_113308 [Dacryopinax primogenitus]|uniref:Nucleoporin NUP188 n=1 Tax=Dacryopinax primogenitus (strain DJM 731) TaxID=1858805 RepID=M5G8X2_DACPD|nr:uncharacterized protein DACRYDRAFT_113308 [Dacryopinax primogenitus]EJU06656.1 hypothetical protein DACRYDRAFT_113308 [Dacryopinax primogenitus]